MNMNDVVVDISKIEGGHKNLNAGEIKEVLRCPKDTMADYDEAALDVVYEYLNGIHSE